MTMGKKAWHKKSRDGCYTCRSRRVKCDERKPICKNCTRQSLPCNFPQTQQLDATTQRSGSVSSEVDALTPSASRPAIMPLYTPHEGPLLNHFFSNTSPSVMIAPLDSQWLQNFVAPKLMTARCGVAMLLATAAIHKADQVPDEREALTKAAYAYRDESLEIIHQALGNLEANTQQFDVIWLTVQMQCYTRLVLFGSHYNSPALKPLERLRAWLDNWAYPNTVSIALLTRGYDVKGSSWSRPALETCGEPLAQPVQKHISRAIDILKAMILDECAPIPLSTFAEELRSSFVCFAMNKSLNNFTDFSIDLRVLFLEASKGSWAALASIVMYAAMLHMIDDNWLIHGLGKDAVLDGATRLASINRKGSQLASWAVDWVTNDRFLSKSPVPVGSE